MRAAAGGSIAAFLDRDRELLAIDATPGTAEGPMWTAVLREVAARWDLWREFERMYCIQTDVSNVVAFWVAPHGVLLVEMAATTTIGLVRLRLKPVLHELERALQHRIH